MTRTIDEIRRYARQEVEAPANQQLIGELCDEIVRLRGVTADPAKCSIIGLGDLDRLMARYLAGPGLSPDEIEILLFALYAESRASGGVAAAAYNKLEARKEIEEGKAGIR